jgi:hypothetical protein
LNRAVAELRRNRDEVESIELSMSSLRNRRWEKFAQEIATGCDPREAYTVAGYKPARANHNRLLRRAELASRIEELKQDRIEAARSAACHRPQF